MASGARPKVSVVVPNYNHARFLRQRLDSIVRQTFQDFELILLDDCSTDRSQSILFDYVADPRVKIEFNDKNSGSTFKQWNKGVKLAEGKYIWIAESDDYADSRFLQTLVARLDEMPTAVLCSCRSWRVSSSGEISGFSDSYFCEETPRWTADFWADGREECRKYLVRCNTIPNASSVVFRKEAYEQVGGADENLVFCGDWKLWASMALTGGGIAYVGQPLNYHRSHEMTVTAKSQRLGVDAAEWLQVIRWLLQRVTPTEETRGKICDEVFHAWHSTILSGRIPLRLRWAILKNARAIDPHALRKLVRPGITALRMTLSRRYRALRSSW